MGHVRKKVIFVSFLLLTSVSASVTCVAQASSSPINSYVTVFVRAGLGNTYEAWIKNLSASPLVAYHVTFDCLGKKIQGYSDAALNYPQGASIGQGESRDVTTLPRECAGGADGILYANGKTVGDAGVVADLQQHRQVARDELRQALEEGILKKPISEWDPGGSVATLRRRLANFQINSGNQEEVAVRQNVLRHLIERIENFEGKANQVPSSEQDRRARFLAALRSWEEVLEASTFRVDMTLWR